MIVFARHALAAPNQAGREPLPPPCTWDYFDHDAVDVSAKHFYATCLAFGTCPKGHCCQIVSTVHSIAGDGTLTPSYVCPVDGCGFHECVRFEGWSPR